MNNQQVSTPSTPSMTIGGMVMVQDIETAVVNANRVLAHTSFESLREQCARVLKTPGQKISDATVVTILLLSQLNKNTLQSEF